MPAQFIRKFIALESASGLLLMFSAALALIVANSPLYALYMEFLHHTPPIAVFGKALSLQHWINDGLMAVFFLMVGCEIKREFLIGELSDRKRAMMPLFAAIGGMLAPALIYLAFNYDAPQNWRGWAIPCATDIAFALGVLSLLGNRVPVTLKAFLLAIAVLDDLGAVIIIALFYTDTINKAALLMMVLIFLILLRFGQKKAKPIWIYLVFGALMWAAALHSGIHATIAGVLLAMALPMKSKNPKQIGPLKSVIHHLHGPVSFMVIPIFGFANAGVNFMEAPLTELLNPKALGIALALFFGKQIGIFGAAFAYARGRRSILPSGCGWSHIYGLSLLCGIGFTMSLFIGNLAYSAPYAQNLVKLGVFAGSLASALGGYCYLRFCRNSAYT